MTAKPRWPVFIPLAVFIFLVLALIVSLMHGGGGNKFALHVGEPAPQTHIPVIGAADVVFDTHDWRGRAYVVNFFASWCVPCHAEHEMLMHFEGWHIPLIGVAYKDKPPSVQAFLVKDGDPFLAVADDAAGHVGIDWGITGVPETFIIDAKGVIRFHYVGPLTDDVMEQQLLPVWKDVTAE